MVCGSWAGTALVRSLSRGCRRTPTRGSDVAMVRAGAGTGGCVVQRGGSDRVAAATAGTAAWRASGKPTPLVKLASDRQMRWMWFMMISCRGGPDGPQASTALIALFGLLCHPGQNRRQVTAPASQTAAAGCLAEGPCSASDTRPDDRPAAGRCHIQPESFRARVARVQTIRIPCRIGHAPLKTGRNRLARHRKSGTLHATLRNRPLSGATRPEPSICRHGRKAILSTGRYADRAL